MTDGLGNVTTYAYNSVEEQPSSSQGQIVPIASEAASFANLPQTPGVPRSGAVTTYGYDFLGDDVSQTRPYPNPSADAQVVCGTASGNTARVVSSGQGGR